MHLIFPYQARPGLIFACSDSDDVLFYLADRLRLAVFRA